MKPIKLVMSAFGSFCGVETIDFSSLGDRGIFLITGETGAGKTTIFDAIMFALYGHTSGDTGESKKGEFRGVNNLRSDYADHDRETFVELTFMHRDKEYRVWRSPSYERLSVRGKMTLKNAAAELILPDEAPITRTSTVDEKIEEILGIGRKDFSQLAMIAQGKFQELLTADNDKRQEIFRKIFSTEIYQRFAEKVKDAYRASDEQCKRVVEEFINALSGVKLIEEDALCKDYKQWAILDNKDKLYSGIKLLPEIIKTIEQDVRQQTVLEKEKAAAEELETELSVQKSKAEHMNQNIEELEKCIKERLILNAQADEIQGLRTALTQAAVAEEIRPYYENFEHTKEALKKSEQDCIQKAEQQKRCAADLTRVEKECAVLPEWQREIQNIGGTVRLLEESRAKYAALTVLQQQEKQYRSALSTVQTLCADTQRKLEAKKAEQAEKEQFLNENKDSGVILSDLQNQYQRAAELLLQLNNLIAMAAAVGRKKKDSEQKKEKFKELQAEYEAKKEQYFSEERVFMSAQAGILAEKLQEGLPCPVCGSCHHPHRAVKSAQAVTQEQLDKDYEIYEHCRKACERSSADSAAANSAYETEKKNFFDSAVFLVGMADRENLAVVWGTITSKKTQTEQELRDLESKIKIEAVKAQQYSDAQKESLELAKAIEALSQKEKRQKDEISEKTAALKAKQAELETIHSQLSYPSEDDLQKALIQQSQAQKRLMQQKEALEKKRSDARSAAQSAEDLQKDAESRHADAERKHATDRLAFEAALAREKWSSEEFLTRVRTKEQKSQMTERVTVYQSQTAILNEREKSLRRLTAGAEKQDITALQKQIEEVHEQKVYQEKRIRALQMRHEQNAQSCNAAQEALKRLTALQEKNAAYKSLNETVNANLSGVDRMTFESYVQTFYFDGVLSVANVRLRRMSGGQYEFHRRKEAEDRRVKTGLELDIFDSYTGKSRPVNTLSGGEKFMSALSLALGMSDVIQNRKSGIQIDTLFIDEGFGSLDEGLLEKAISILNDLTTGDKMIGIISHVEALKRRIDKKIVVKKTQSGSRIDFCGEE